MEKVESFGESAISWAEGEIVGASTNLPEVLAEETAVGTLIIIIVSAIISITLLFIMAVFIDCRQQKLTRTKHKIPKKIFRLSIPRFGRPLNTVEDQETFADKMQTQDSAPPATVAVV